MDGKGLEWVSHLFSKVFEKLSPLYLFIIKYLLNLLDVIYTVRALVQNLAQFLCLK